MSLNLSAPTTRRQMLRSSLALGAFVLPSVLGTPVRAAASRRRARGVIMIMLEGGMSHLDTWDPKPRASDDIRGEFGTIATSVPGLRIGEHMPFLAKQAHRFNLIRSVHCDARNDHSPGMHLLLTGWEYLAATVTGGPRERANHEHPSQGAIIAHQLGVTTPNGVSRFIALPRRGQLNGGVTYATSAFLGASYEAFETGSVPANPRTPVAVPPSLVLSNDVSFRRLADRQTLREQFNRLNDSLDRAPATRGIDAHYESALSILSGRRMGEAFDVGREPVGLRERYGTQNLLLARRLVEAGATYVLVNDFGNWDTHSANFAGHKTRLPPVDRAVSALLEDLDQRGLLDEVMVVLLSEMGRAPRINKAAGRDHWTSAYSVMLAGGGLTRGQVLGSTTPLGDQPGHRPVTVPEILATIYQRLGVDSNVMLADEQKRPIPILPGEAKPIGELIA
jgi:hypothetical protein